MSKRPEGNAVVQSIWCAYCLSCGEGEPSLTGASRAECQDWCDEHNRDNHDD